MINYAQHNTSNSNQVPVFAGSITGDLIQVGQKMQERYDAAYTQDEMLKRALRSTTALPQDKKYLNDLVQKYKGKLEQRAQRGDYENMLQQTAFDSQDFVQEYQPVVQNTQRYSEYQKKLEKLVEGGMRPDKAQKLLQASISSYKGLQVDEDGRVGNFFSGMDPVKDINLPEKVDKYMAHIAPSVLGQKVHNVNGRWMTVSGRKVKEVSATQIDRVLAAAASIDPELQGWLNQEAELNTLGLDRVTLKDIKDPMIAEKIQQESLRTGLEAGTVYREMAKGQERLRILNGMRQYADKYQFREDERESGITGGNPYAVEKERADNERKNNFTVVPTIGVSKGLDIKSAGDVNQQDTDLGVQLDNSVKNMQDFVAALKRRSKAEGGDGEYYSRGDRRFIKVKDADGQIKEVDVTTKYLMKASDVKYAKEQKEAFEKTKKQAMDESGYTEALKRDKPLIAQAQKAYDDVFNTVQSWEGKAAGPGAIPSKLELNARHVYDLTQTFKGQGYSDKEAVNKAKQQVASEAYDKVMQNSAPYKRYLKTLQDKLNSAPEQDATYLITNEAIRKNLSESFTDLVSALGGDGSPLKLTAASGENIDIQLTPDDYDELKGALTVTGFSTDDKGQPVLVARAHGKIKGKNTEGKEMLIRIPNVQTSFIQNMLGEENYMQYRRAGDIKAKLNASPAKNIQYTDLIGNDYNIRTVTDNGVKKYIVEVPSTNGVQEVPVTSREGILSVIDQVNKAHLLADPAQVEKLARTANGSAYLKLLGYGQ